MQNYAEGVLASWASLNAATTGAARPSISVEQRFWFNPALTSRFFLIPGSIAIVDTADREVGRITKQWRGLLTEGFTTADSWAVTTEHDVTGALRQLILASGAAIDTALKQDE